MDISCFCLGRLYCCSSQRKSKGERIISELIPTLLISHHSLPQPLIYRRVNFFSLFSLFGVTNSLFPLLLPLLLFRKAQHYRHSFPRGTEQQAERERGERTLAVKFPGEGGGTFLTPPLTHTPSNSTSSQRKQRLMEKQAREINSPPLRCTTPWKLKINKEVCICLGVVRVAAGGSVNTLRR